MRQIPRPYPFLVTLVLTGMLAGCKSGGRQPREDPIMRLSSAEALEEGKAYLERKKYFRARRLLTHAFEVEPNSRGGREALLLAADAYFLQGGPDNYIQCEAKYRDFLNRFPTSAQADYAQFQIGNCMAERIPKPDRDQKVSLQALDAFGELMRLFPSSSYVEEAQLKIDEVTDNLGSYELNIGKFNYRFGICAAAIDRLTYLQEQYPRFSKMDECLLVLAQAYRLCGQNEQADATYVELKQGYPESSLVAKIDKSDKEATKLRDRLLKRQRKR